ncbi:MAG: sel1 repeat family protein [Bacteroidales bacterium]|nr:sel1 repeat family protein [Bacteroidales bacterium]
MRNFLSNTYVRNLTFEQVDEIYDKADEGNPQACFQKALVLMAWRDEDDWEKSAHKMLLKAKAGGVIDAEAVIADMIRYGELEKSDFARAKKLLDKSLAKGSEFAAKYHIENLLFGLCGTVEDPEAALEFIDNLLAQSDNPMWYYYKGLAIERTDCLSAAKEWYDKALEWGVAEAIADYATAVGFDDEYELEDQDAYEKILDEGCKLNNPMCKYLKARLQGAKWYELPPENEEEKDELLDDILDNLESAATLGLAEASLWLGHIYKEGLYDLETDLEQAWAWYEDGAQFRSGECYEAMYAMAVQGLLHSPQEGRKIADLCAIKGARCGSRMMLRATVEAYYDGRLQGFASEIEEYYIPVYTLLGGEEDDEEDYDEDDGRYDAWS